MATKSEVERLERVETLQGEMATRLSAVQMDVNAIKTTLDNLNGGRKALLWGVSTLMGLGLIVIGIANLFKK